jgi:DNA-binding NarL/FixJ family response regulator
MPRILLVEDHPDFAAALKRSLAAEEDLEIVKHASYVAEVKDYISATNMQEVDCVLLDLHLPREKNDRTTDPMAGLHLLKEMRQTYSFWGTIIILTSSQELQDGQRALQLGCDGYLCKNTKLSELKDLVAELKAALRGNVILVSSKMRHVFMREEISAKEARLMDLLLNGKSWSEIARELSYVSSKAAANMGDRVFDKLISMDARERLAAEGVKVKKRELALEIWKKRGEGSSSEAASSKV